MQNISNFATRSDTGEAGAPPTGNNRGSARSSTPALKEWAAVCKAILEGEQIVTLRKGGIREEGRKFRPEHMRFCLFPTYEHQSPELLKPGYEFNVDSALDAHDNSFVEISGWCEINAIEKVTELEELEALSSRHIWTTEYVTERLRWKRRDPLWVLILRAYRFESTIRIPKLEQYGGCKSWIDLDVTLEFSGKPVLSDSAFAAKSSGL